MALLGLKLPFGKEADNNSGKKSKAASQAKSNNQAAAAAKIPESGVIKPSFKVKGPVEKELVQIKEQLRALEDTEFVTKLEAVAAADDVAALKAKLEDTKKKVDVLTEAVQTLTEGLAKKIELKELKRAVIAPPQAAPTAVGAPAEIPTSITKKIAEIDELAAQLQKVNTRIETLQGALRDVQRAVALKVGKAKTAEEREEKEEEKTGLVGKLLKLKAAAPSIEPGRFAAQLSDVQKNLKELSAQTRAKLDELEHRLKEELGVKGMKTVMQKVEGISSEIADMRKKVGALDTSLRFVEREVTKIPALDTSLRFVEQEIVNVKRTPISAALSAAPTPIASRAIEELKDKMQTLGYAIKDIESEVSQLRARMEKEERAALLTSKKPKLFAKAVPASAAEARPAHIAAPPSPEIVDRLKKLESEISIYKPELARIRADITRTLQRVEELSKIREAVTKAPEKPKPSIFGRFKRASGAPEAKAMEGPAPAAHAAPAVGGIRSEFETLKGQFSALSNRVNQALLDLKAVRTNFGVVQDGYDVISKRQSETFKELDAVKNKLVESIAGLQAAINSIERRLEPLSALESWVADRVYRYEDNIKQLQMDLLTDFVDLEERLKKEDEFVRKSLAEEDTKLRKEIVEKEAALRQEMRDANMVLTGRVDQLAQKVEPVADLESWIADKIAAHEKEDQLLHQKIEQAESNLVAKIEAAEEKAMGEIRRAEEKLTSDVRTTEEKLMSDVRTTEEKLTSDVRATEERAISELKEVEEKMVAEIQALEAGKVIPAIEERISPLSKEIGALKIEMENLMQEKATLIADIERIILKQEEQIIKRVHFDELRREISEKVDARLARLNEKVQAAEDVIRKAEEKIENIDSFVSTAIERAIGARVEALERERDYLRSELANLRQAYFRLAEEERAAPLVIE